MTNDDKNLTETSSKYYCENCDFRSCRQSQYSIHLLTAKHKRMTNNDENLSDISTAFACECGKQYKYRQGLHNHKKKCSQKQQKIENTMLPNNENINLNVLVIDLLKQNQELQKQLIELSKEKTITNTNSHNNTQNNNHFNLQFFLNETCKDAITADQFVKDIQISFGDLENIGNQGYVQGFTDIILKQLRTLDVTKRPFHCTDVKRETIYIKDADAWKKDTEEKTKLKNVIEKVAHKGRSNVNSWQQTHPEVAVLDSNDYDMNHKILRNTWGDGETDKLQEKVVKNLAKEVQVEKETAL
jgi:hypothetical protein